MEKRIFHLGVILSAYQSKFVATGEMEEFQDFLEFFTGKNVMHTQMTKSLWGQCSKELLKQLPFLSEVDNTDLNPKTWKAWLAKYIEKFGEFHEIAPSTIPIKIDDFMDYPCKHPKRTILVALN